MRQQDDMGDQRGLVAWLRGRLDLGNGVPIYLQVTEGIDRAILLGQIRPGDFLPTVREMAGQLRIAPNTVSRAFSELARRGLIESRAGAGTVVIASATPATERQQVLKTDLRDVLLKLRRSGMKAADLRSLLTDLLLEVEAV